MNLIKGLLVAIATLIAAVLGGVAAATVYRRLKYPHVPVEETDVFFDIGLAFYLGFTAVIAAAVVACILRFRKRCPKVQ